MLEIRISVPELLYFQFEIPLMLIISATTYMLTAPKFQLILFIGALGPIFPTAFHIFPFGPVIVSLHVNLSEVELFFFFS